MSMFMCLFLVVLSKHAVVSWNPSRSFEGFHDGLTSKCPSTIQPGVISQESLKKLGLIILDSNASLKNGRTYNYYQANLMAKDSNWDPKKPTVFFVGGYLDNPNVWMYSKVLGKEHKRLNANVILLQAFHFMVRQYPIAVRMIRPIGFHVAEMLTNLTKAGLDPKTFHMVGVSLGAQTMSFIAKSFYKLTGTKVGRMTGLDPSGPCFRNLEPDQRLDSSDTDFLDILHCNNEGLGMAAPVGHVNFYINGGEYQPNDLYFLPCNLLCSHVKALFVWYTALTHPNSFIGIKCDSVEQARRNDCYDRVPLETNVVGMNVNKSNTGIFYLATAVEFPYYLGQDGLKKENMVWKKLDSKYDSSLMIL